MAFKFITSALFAVKIQQNYLELKFILRIEQLSLVIYINNVEQILENDVFIVGFRIKIKSVAQITNILE